MTFSFGGAMHHAVHHVGCTTCPEPLWFRVGCMVASPEPYVVQGEAVRVDRSRSCEIGKLFEEYKLHTITFNSSKETIRCLRNLEFIVHLKTLLVLTP